MEQLLTTVINYIFALPIIFKLISVLLLIIIFNLFTKNLVISIIPGIIILALWSGHTFTSILQISWLRLSSLDNLLLVLIIFQVIWLSLQMEQSGIMSELVAAVQANVKPKTALAMLPALIGLLPMPGGALFSAPMVDDLDKTKNIPPLSKTKINYWFRHFWEYILPLYPGVILAIDLTGLPVWQFILLQLPLSLFFILGGYIFILRPLKTVPGPEVSSGSKPQLKQLFMLILPILLVIGIDILLSTIFPSLTQISSYIPMSIGLLISQTTLFILRPLPVSTLKKIFLSPKTVELVMLVVLVRIYAAFIEARLPDGLFLMEHVREELLQAHFPLVLIVMLVTFLSGMTTGLAVGFVGASFPIVINLAGNDPALSKLMAFTVLGYAFGHIGMMISPVHTCHLVTNQYFKTDLNKSALQIIAPASFVLAAGIILFFILINIA